MTRYMIIESRVVRIVRLTYAEFSPGISVWKSVYGVSVMFEDTPWQLYESRSEAERALALKALEA